MEKIRIIPVMRSKIRSRNGTCSLVIGSHCNTTRELFQYGSTFTKVVPQEKYMLHGGTIFTDHVSRYVSTGHQVNLSYG